MHQKQMPAADDLYDSLAIEYKTDYKAAQTGNVFVETVSVDTAGKVGWAYESRADYLV